MTAAEEGPRLAQLLRLALKTWGLASAVLVLLTAGTALWDPRIGPLLLLLFLVEWACRRVAPAGLSPRFTFPFLAPALLASFAVGAVLAKGAREGPRSHVALMFAAPPTLDATPELTLDVAMSASRAGVYLVEAFCGAARAEGWPAAPARGAGRREALVRILGAKAPTTVLKSARFPLP